jgi:hypothetical protein
VSSDGDRRSGKEQSGGDEPESGRTRRQSSDRRGAARIKKRIPCEFASDGKKMRGFVLDVSPEGLFVQTLKPINPGREIAVTFKLPNSDQAIELRGCVVRNRQVPRHLASVTTAGVGLQINNAPPEYFEFVASLCFPDENAPKAGSADAASEESEKPAPEKKKRKLPPRMPKPESMTATETPTETSYRVRAKQKGGNRSRLLVVSASSREQAMSLALEQIGSDFEIVDVESS